MVTRRRFAPNQPLCHQSIDQTNRAVVANLQPFRKLPNTRRFSPRESFDSKKRLVMLRRDSGGVGCRLAEMQKTTQRVTKRCQKFVLIFGELRFHRAESPHVDIYRVTIYSALSFMQL